MHACPQRDDARNTVLCTKYYKTVWARMHEEYRNNHYIKLSFASKMSSAYMTFMRLCLNLNQIDVCMSEAD